MKKIFFGLSLSLFGITISQAQQNNDSMKTAKKMISEKQSQSDRILEVKLKKQNLTLKTMNIPDAETGENSEPENSKKKI